MPDRVDILFHLLLATLGAFVSTAIIANLIHYTWRLVNRHRPDRRAVIGTYFGVFLLVAKVLPGAFGVVPTSPTPAFLFSTLKDQVNAGLALISVLLLQGLCQLFGAFIFVTLQKRSRSEASTASNSEEKSGSSGKTHSRVVFVWLAAGVGVLAAFVWSANSMINKLYPPVEDQIEKEIEEMQSTLPRQMDEQTVLTKASLEGATVKLIFQLSMKQNEIDETALRRILRSQVKKGACSQAPLRRNLEEGIIYRYDYLSSDNKRVASIRIKEEDCRTPAEAEQQSDPS